MPPLDLKVPVLWFNRLFKHGIDRVRELKKKGFKVVMDLDDHFCLDPDHYLYEAWNRTRTTERLVEMLQQADVVLTTNDVLADQIRKVVRVEVVIAPNALPFDTGQFTLSSDRESSTRFVYIAGPSHIHDVKLLDLQDDLTTAGITKVGVPYKDPLPSLRYMDLYDGHRAALAPLLENSFNVCKSNLKLLEAGAKGLPLFASRVHPYFNWKDSTVIRYLSTSESWSERLKKYSDSHLADIGRATAEHVRKHYQLRDSNAIRKQVFESFA